MVLLGNEEVSFWIRIWVNCILKLYGIIFYLHIYLILISVSVGIIEVIPKSTRVWVCNYDDEKM